MLPATAERVAINTSIETNRQIQKEIECNIAYYAEHPEDIDDRLEELDREFDIERTIEMNAAALMLTGSVMALKNRWFLLLPITVAGFLMQHSIQGWCPPVPLFRNLGFRTATEIERERYALKALRGDFEGVQNAAPGDTPTRGRLALAAARA